MVINLLKETLKETIDVLINVLFVITIIALLLGLYFCSVRLFATGHIIFGILLSLFLLFVFCFIGLFLNTRD